MFLFIYFSSSLKKMLFVFLKNILLYPYMILVNPLTLFVMFKIFSDGVSNIISYSFIIINFI